MTASLRFLLAVAALAGLSAPAQASTTIEVNLTTNQESIPIVPTTTLGAPRPTAFGHATFVINDAMTSMTMFVTVSNLDFTGSQTADINDNLLNAHIHAGTFPPPPALQNLPVVWGFFGAPFNDNNPNDAVVTPFSTGVGGTISGKWDATEGNNTTFLAQLQNILAGRAYINFHTTQFTGGEIRGNFPSSIPEPSAWALMLLGFGLMGVAVRRQNTREAGRLVQN